MACPGLDEIWGLLLFELLDQDRRHQVQQHVLDDCPTCKNCYAEAITVLWELANTGLSCAPSPSAERLLVDRLLREVGQVAFLPTERFSYRYTVRIELATPAVGDTSRKLRSTEF